MSSVGIGRVDLTGSVQQAQADVNKAQSPRVDNHGIARATFRDHAREQAGSTTDEGSTAQYTAPPHVAPPPVSVPVQSNSEPQEMTLHKLSSMPNDVAAVNVGSKYTKPAVASSCHLYIPVNDGHHLLRGCLRRIEVLESLSSSQVPVEEIEDKWKNLDARLLRPRNLENQTIC